MMAFFRPLHFQRPVYIIVFNVLTHYIIDRIDSTAIHDLKIGCGVKNRPKSSEQDVQINELPNDCSSLILCIGDFDGEDSLNTFLKTSPSKPLILLDDTFSYEDWIHYFTQKHHDVNKYIDFIEKFKCDGLIFVGMYTLESNMQSNEVILNSLPAFFQEIRTHCNDKGLFPKLGVVIPGTTDTLTTLFKYDKIDSIVDMYLVNSIVYTGECKDGKPLSPLDYIQGVTRVFDQPPLNTVNRSKVIFGMQLYVQYGTEDNKFSYGEACARCPNENVIFCKDSLDTMYQKGLAVHQGNFAGMYLRFINDDDIYGCCNCTSGAKFPGFNAYVSGFNGQAIPDGYKECNNYGKPGTCKIQNKCVPNPAA